MSPDTALDISFSGYTHKRFPRYGVIGIATILVAEVLLFLSITPIGMYFTPIVWTGYIIFVDALIFYKYGSSLIMSRRKEFLAMLPWSILCWLIFEAYNLYLKNWTYVGLPDNVILRSIGYAWSFATIFPAILETGELVNLHLPTNKSSDREVSNVTLIAFIIIGIVCLVAPLVVSHGRATQMFGLVWIGFYFLIDPINHILRGKSILQEVVQNNYSTLISLICSGIICGLLWEFWNYWAIAKWMYNVPISIVGPKLFEMPLLGYLGFIPFAFECYVLQQLLVAIFRSLSMPERG